MTWRDPTAGARGRFGADTRIRRAFDSLSGRINSLNTGVPLGVPMPYLGSTAPSGYVLCYGQTITNASTTYPELWAVIDSTWKSGTSLVLPDLRGRVIAGLDNIGGTAASRLPTYTTMGAAGGAATHTLVTGEIPSHNHTQKATDHKIAAGGGADLLGMTFSGGNSNYTAQQATVNTGGGGSHNNTQPTIAMNYILEVR